jgi:2-haloalkanoic acid dehalogenase type II
VTIRVITFDLDNTLWDVEPALLRAEEAQRNWLLEHRPGSMEAVGHEALWELKKRLWAAHPELAHNVSALRQLLLRELQLAAGYSDSEARDGAEAAFAIFLAERQRVELYEDALEVLAQLAGDYRLGALTNGNADVYKTDAGDYFDFAFLAEEIGASKPAPDMFRAALAHAGARPAEVLHVGDNPDHDVRGALAVGMRTAWINASDEKWDGEGRPDVTLRHVRELPAALPGLTRR